MALSEACRISFLISAPSVFSTYTNYFYYSYVLQCLHLNGKNKSRIGYINQMIKVWENVLQNNLHNRRIVMNACPNFPYESSRLH